ncbi:MAG TPA: glycosyl hydrolase 43 family protein [Pseudoalteromonas prydzensis]|uniref:Glycosyl hydrolase 43 family protein n=1 Tax=Pseudoalteromonas prydzensis TaxID=182141 RepID=A0A7V1D3D5_9GAMM|nr:glycoside hydrolase 43 family protein [Pseudoalteromonas prydzensis]HEA19168.1 glycosyl hydrolase 43 family protein [Pseudoalteromonas prydzensis]
MLSNKYYFYLALLLVCLSSSQGYAKELQLLSQKQTQNPWQADLGNGEYKNPILHADYSDPDVVAVNGHYYMTASSFNSAPGLPILHSTDLVNWQLINYALPIQLPQAHFAKVQHGNGVWAPTIRFHDNKFWIFYPDADFGIYVTTAKDPAATWSTPELILAGKGLIDPAPLWDDNGKAYLVHAWAKSRAGFNNVLTLREMSDDASWVSDKFTHIVDGKNHPGYRTIEGPKFYKRNGYYYIFAPAGGVDLGWQSVFRATAITGPYEAKVVMAQGNSVINGPHQGAWVHTKFAEDWFIHFQSKQAYGRITHLQPMRWEHDWPIIGVDKNANGTGQPVLQYTKPQSELASQPTSIVNNDEFNSPELNLLWQWNANPSSSWYSLTDNPGFLRLYSQPITAQNSTNLWSTPSLLLQKIPAEQFAFTTTLQVNKTSSASSSGLILFGEDYAWIGIKTSSTGEQQLVYVHCFNARKGCKETIVEQQPLIQPYLELKVVLQPGATAIFSYRTAASAEFKIIGEHFQAKKGRWVGAKLGLFSLSQDSTTTRFADFDYARYSTLD